MTINISGYCADQFEPVRRAFETNFIERDDIGASVAITLEGEFVVDLWAGHVDQSKSEPWQSDTLVNVWSSTKTMSAMALLVLADRGEVDLYSRVSKYWPEFAQNGKQDVQVRHVLSHTAGLSGLDEYAPTEALYDWNRIIRYLERQKPWWQPGTRSGYHVVTQGFLVGELVRRIAGLSIGRFFHNEIADPLQADFYIGTPPSLDGRISDLIPPERSIPTPEDGSFSSRTFSNPRLDINATRCREWRSAEIPAINGHGNARSIVRAQTPLANGGTAFGKSILSESGARRIFDKQTDGIDLVLRAPISFGMGYGLNRSQHPIGPNKNICFWGGYGGSSVLIDQDARLCFSYVMNRMDGGVLGDSRAAHLIRAMYNSMSH